MGEGDKIYVSDLDIAWVKRDGEILPDSMIFNDAKTGVGNLINKNYGLDIVQHGAQSNYPGRLDTWLDYVDIFGPDGYIASGNLRKTWMIAEGTLEYLP